MIASRAWLEFSSVRGKYSIVLLGLVLLAARPVTGASENIDLKAFLDSTHPRVEALILSSAWRPNANLDRARFEAHLDHIGPDYRIQVFSLAAARRIGRAVAGLDLSRGGSAGEMDLRYKVVFFDASDQVAVLYVDWFGRILADDRVLVPASGVTWLHDLISGLSEDIKVTGE